MVESALDLDVWKEIAIAKQMLIKTATDALGLDPDCTEVAFKDALERGIRQITDADLKVSEAAKENQISLDAVNKTLQSTEEARAELQSANGQLESQKQALEVLLAVTRKNTAEELKKANAQLDEKVKALKAINVILADTPANVVKKLKSLNKKKLDETNAKKRAEDEVRALKKEKKELQRKLEDNESSLEASAKLVDQYRELRTFSDEQYTQLKKLVKKTEDLKSLPELDAELLESLENSADTEKTEDAK